MSAAGDSGENDRSEIAALRQKLSDSEIAKIQAQVRPAVKLVGRLLVCSSGFILRRVRAAMPRPYPRQFSRWPGRP